MDNESGTPETAAEEKAPKEKRTLRDYLGDLYELLEMLGLVSATIMLMFAFVFRLNIVDGHSMDMTLAHGEYLGVSDLFYDPEPGDIVIIHKINADPYGCWLFAIEMSDSSELDGLMNAEAYDAFCKQ